MNSVLGAYDSCNTSMPEGRGAHRTNKQHRYQKGVQDVRAEEFGHEGFYGVLLEGKFLELQG